MGDVTSVVNGGANLIFAPVMLILYKLLVVWPNQIIYWFLDIIQKLTGFDNDGLNSALLNQNGQLYKTFLIFGSIGLGVGICAFIFGYVKIVATAQNDKKMQVMQLFKRTAFAVAISTLLPMLFYFCSLILNTIFSSVFTQITKGSMLNDKSDTVFGIIIKNLKTNTDNSYTLMNKIFVFNTWTVGYSGEFVTQDKQIAQGLQPVITSINNLQSGDMFAGDGFDLIKSGDLTKWNVLLSGIASIVFLFGIITFVVSVISRLLWVYILMIIAPLILGGGVAMEKNTSKFTVDFVQKLIVVQVAVIGYFLFSVIYVTILTTLNSRQSAINITQAYGSIGSRILQFAILFAGITLINQIPVAMLKYFNSNEQVVSNELQEARSQINRVTQPLQTAMTSVIGGSVANARNIGRATGNSLGELKLNAPTSLK